MPQPDWYAYIRAKGTFLKNISNSICIPLLVVLVANNDLTVAITAHIFILGGHPRLEIRVLRDKPEQFTLFIHALATVMKPEHRPRAARFVDIGECKRVVIAYKLFDVTVAGIHGLPYERWR